MNMSLQHGLDGTADAAKESERDDGGSVKGEEAKVKQNCEAMATRNLERMRPKRTENNQRS